MSDDTLILHPCLGGQLLARLAEYHEDWEAVARRLG